MTDQKAHNKLSYIIHLGSYSSYEYNSHYQWSLIPLHSIGESQIQLFSSRIYISCTESLWSFQDNKRTNGRRSGIQCSSSWCHRLSTRGTRKIWWYSWGHWRATRRSWQVRAWGSCETRNYDSEQHLCRWWLYKDSTLNCDSGTHAIDSILCKIFPTKYLGLSLSNCITTAKTLQLKIPLGKAAWLVWC